MEFRATASELFAVSPGSGRFSIRRLWGAEPALHVDAWRGHMARARSTFRVSLTEARSRGEGGGES